MNKGVNDAVPIQKSEILNSKKNGEFFIVGAVINGNSVYLYSYNDGNRIKCFRHYGQDVAIGGFVVMEISNINIEDGTASIDFKTETYPLQQSVLTKTNTTPFTPTGDYHPATKKYVDEKNVMYKMYFYTEPGVGNHLMINDPEGNDIEAERFKNILINNPYLNITFSPLLKSSEKTKCIGIDNYTMFFLSKDKTLNILNISNLSTQNQHMDYLLTTYDLVDKDSVLTKTNTTEYTPSQKYHPATKKYVDDNISQETYIIEMNMEYARTLLGYSIAIKNKQGENQQVQYIKQLISQGYDNFIFKDHYSGIEGGGYGKCTAISKSNYTLFFSYSTYIVKINLTNVDDDNYLVDDTVYFKYRLLKYEDDLFDIIKMKNYSLGTDKSQITTYDTVNKAISKLEARIKALEEK